jgi:hypothetical protein
MTNQSKARPSRTNKEPQSQVHASRAPVGESKLQPRRLERPELVDDLCFSIGDKLIRASELAAEALANMVDEGNTRGGAYLSLCDLHLELWRARWELGLVADDVRVPRAQLRKMAFKLEAAADTAPRTREHGS